MKALTKGQLKAERDYLLLRASRASVITFGGAERFTGNSSNAMVAHACGGPEPSVDSYPSDLDDLLSCRRARNLAPKHLWPRMDALYAKYAAYVEARWPGAAEEAERAVPFREAWP